MFSQRQKDRQRQGLRMGLYFQYRRHLRCDAVCSAQTDKHSRAKLPFFTFSVTDVRWFVWCYLSTKINGGTFKTIPVVVFTAIGNFSIILFFYFSEQAWCVLLVTLLFYIERERERKL